MFCEVEIEAKVVFYLFFLVTAHQYPNQFAMKRFFITHTGDDNSVRNCDVFYVESRPVGDCHYVNDDDRQSNCCWRKVSRENVVVLFDDSSKLSRHTWKNTQFRIVLFEQCTFSTSTTNGDTKTNTQTIWNRQDIVCSLACCIYNSWIELSLVNSNDIFLIQYCVLVEYFTWICCNDTTFVRTRVWWQLIVDLNSLVVLMRTNGR